MMGKYAALLTIVFLIPGPVSGEEIWRHYVNGNQVQDIARSGDSLWCATQGSVVRWNLPDGSHTQFTTSDGLVWPNADRVVLDRDGLPWVTHNGLPGRASHYDGNRWTTLDLVAAGVDKSAITALLPDSRGDIWVATLSSKLGRRSGNSWQWFTPDDALDKAFRDIAVDSRGTVWAAAGSGGAVALSGDTLRVYTEADGLAGDTVRCVKLDAEGRIWFGATKGISSFDGTGWNTWTRQNGLANNAVNDIAFGPGGTVWAATDGGVSRFDGATWSSWKEADGLIADKCAGIAVDDSGYVWVCHPSEELGVSRFNGTKWDWISTWNSGIPTNRVYAVTRDRAGVLWFGTDWGICSFDGEAWKNWSSRDGLAADTVAGIEVDGLDRKWIWYDRSAAAGMTRFDGSTFRTYTTADGLQSDIVSAIAGEESGAIWVCAGSGFSRFDGESWQHFPGNNRLRSSTATDIAEGPDGTMWFATDRGLSRHDGAGWYTWTTADGLPSNKLLQVEAAPDGRIWALADSGLVSFDGEQFRHHPLGERPVFDESDRLRVDRQGNVFIYRSYAGSSEAYFEAPIWMLSGDSWKKQVYNLPSAHLTMTPLSFLPEDDGASWIGYEGGLLRYPPESPDTPTPYRISDCPPDTYSSAMAVDRNNVKWFVSGFGVSSFDDTRGWTDHSSGIRAAVSEPYNWPFNGILIGRDNTIWITSIHGIDFYNGITWKHYTGGDGIDLADEFLRIELIGAEDRDGVLWLVSDRGVITFDGSAWRRYTTADGMASDRITCMAVDANNVKWFGTDKGVCSYDGKDWKTYTTVDGLPAGEVLSMAVDPDNRKWFGFRSGLSRFDGISWQTWTNLADLPANNIMQIKTGSDGSVWAQAGEQLAVFRNNQWKSFEFKCYFRAPLALDQWNTLWTVNEQQSAILSCDGDSIRYHTFAGASGIMVDRNGCKWIIRNLGQDSNSYDGIYSLDNRAQASDGDRPRALTLLRNYPNPFNAETRIAFEMQSWGPVNLDIYTITGQRVRRLLSGPMDAGRHAVPWDGTDDAGRRLSSGVYLYRLSIPGATEKAKMMFLK